MTKQSPQQVLRLAESVPENGENYQILRELRAALKDLVAVSEAGK